MCYQCLGDRARPLIAQTKGLGDRRYDQLGIANRSQLNEADSVPKCRFHAGRNLQRQPGLADPAGSDQHYETDTFIQHENPDVSSLALTTDE
jgi:hypothetical protein